MSDFTNTIPGFLKKRPKTTLAATLVIGASIGGLLFQLNTPDGATGANIRCLGTTGSTVHCLNDKGNTTQSGAILSESGGTIGWTVQAAANQSCSTTCTHACVFGVNTAATEADIVDCADTTADECLCAGPS